MAELKHIIIRRIVNCESAMCKAYTLTTNEFMLLRGEQWTQSFKTALGKQAGKLYEQLYGKKRSRRVRTHLMAQTSRNKVRTYPCGILEQAYRQLCRDRALVGPSSASLDSIVA